MKVVDCVLRAAQSFLIAAVCAYGYWLVLSGLPLERQWIGRSIEFYLRQFQLLLIYTPLPPESFWYPFQGTLIAMRIGVGLAVLLVFPVIAALVFATVIRHIFSLGWDLSIGVADIRRLGVAIRRRLPNFLKPSP